MCVDPADTLLSVDKYVEDFPAFEDTRKHKLLKVRCVLALCLLFFYRRGCFFCSLGGVIGNGQSVAALFR